MEAGVKVAVTPLGRLLTDSAMADLNPFKLVADSLSCIDPPGARLTLVALGVRVKVGVKIVNEMA